MPPQHPHESDRATSRAVAAVADVAEGVRLDDRPVFLTQTSYAFAAKAVQAIEDAGLRIVDSPARREWPEVDESALGPGALSNLGPPLWGPMGRGEAWCFRALIAAIVIGLVIDLLS